MLGPLGSTELIIIFGIAVLMFGAAKIPELGKGLGSGIREFKKGLRAAEDEDEETTPKIEQSEDV